MCALYKEYFPCQPNISFKSRKIWSSSTLALECLRTQSQSSQIITWLLPQECDLFKVISAFLDWLENLNTYYFSKGQKKRHCNSLPFHNIAVMSWTHHDCNVLLKPGQFKSAIDLLIVSSDLQRLCCGHLTRRGAKLSADRHLAVGRIRWSKTTPLIPGMPKDVVRICWECLAEKTHQDDLPFPFWAELGRHPRGRSDIETR